MRAASPTLSLLAASFFRALRRTKTRLMPKVAFGVPSPLTHNLFCFMGFISGSFTSRSRRAAFLLLHLRGLLAPRVCAFAFAWSFMDVEHLVTVASILPPIPGWHRHWRHRHWGLAHLRGSSRLFTICGARAFLALTVPWIL